MNKQAKEIIGLSCKTAFAILCLSFGACSWVPKGESSLDVGIKDRGMASWYGEQFHGKQAANGEIFNMEAMTAAHRTLPLGSVVRVVNLANGKHVRVRINDRGPYVNGRILDLSHGAASRLGMVEGGVSVIQLEVVGDHRPEFMIAAQEAMSLSATPVALRPLVPGEVQSPRSLPVCEDATLSLEHRLAPIDIMLVRRLRRISSLLAADHTAHAEIAALALD